MSSVFTVEGSCQALALVLLGTIAWQDWTQRRISNICVLLLIGLALFQLLAGFGHPDHLLLNLALVLLVSLPGLWKPVFGAGDVKLLLALALLWPTGVLLVAFAFGIFTLIALCAIADRLGARQGPAEGARRHGQALQQLKNRGLPLGTALALGSKQQTQKQ